MAANNTAPIFTGIPDIQWGTTPLTTANTAKDGTGTTLTVFTADVTNGGYVSRLTVRALGTNTATVLRLFVNNGAASSTASNNALIAEITVPATTLSEVSAVQHIEIPLNFALPPGYKLLCAIGTTVAAGLVITVFGGKYTAST